MKIQSTQDLLKMANSVHRALQSMGGSPARDFGKSLGTIIASLEASSLEVDQANERRASLVRIKDAHSVELRETLRRVRSAVGAAFGDDSNEYGSVGRKRRSEHKRPKRKESDAVAPRGQAANG